MVAAWRRKSARAVAAAVTVTCWLWDENPMKSTRTVTSPTGTAGRRNSPVRLVRVPREVPAMET